MEISLHSDMLFCFRANQVFRLFLNHVCIVEKQQLPIIIFDSTRQGLEPTIDLLDLTRPGLEPTIALLDLTRTGLEPTIDHLLHH